MTQMNLGAALGRIGERQSGSDKLKDSASAYREALKELTNHAVPDLHLAAREKLGQVNVILEELRNRVT